jgi:hypothetical protein
MVEVVEVVVEVVLRDSCADDEGSADEVGVWQTDDERRAMRWLRVAAE